MNDNVKFGLSSNHLDANFKKTENFLNNIYNIGFNYYELELTNYSLLANHCLIKKRKDDFIKVLKSLPLSYAIHLPLVIDIGDSHNNYDDLFKTFIDFSIEAGITDLILHPSKNRKFGHQDSEIKTLQRLSKAFIDSGITVHLENLLNYKGHNGGYNYNVSLHDNIQLLDAINKDCYGYCLDIGHGYITTKYREENLIEEVSHIMNRITHLHVHDNFGKIPEVGNPLTKHESAMMGFGDLHMPPTWGDIPYEKMKELFNGYSGKVTIELFKDYLGDLDDILATTKELFN